MRGLKKKFRFFIEFFFSAEGAFAIGVTGLILGYYFYYINRPILEYETKTGKIISSNNDTGIKITVDGKDYDNLYLTNVVLKNTGGTGLSGKDVSPLHDDPVRIVFPPQNKIVGYHIDNNMTSDEISGTLIPSDNEVVIQFNYINPDSQITVNIVHEENSGDFKMKGNALNVSSIEPKKHVSKCTWLCWGGTILFYIVMYLLYVFRRKEEGK